MHVNTIIMKELFLSYIIIFATWLTVIEIVKYRTDISTEISMGNKISQDIEFNSPIFSNKPIENWFINYLINFSIFIVVMIVILATFIKYRDFFRFNSF